MLHWPSGWHTQWATGVWKLVLAKSGDLPPVWLLGNCPAMEGGGPGAPSIICDVHSCLEGTSSVVPCPGSHQLQALDSCASVRHGGTADNTLWNSLRILNWETIQKTNRPLSIIPINQAYDQNYAAFKGDGGAVGLTDRPRTLRLWMMAGPEVTRLIEQFHDETDSGNRTQDIRQHDQLVRVQNAFLKDINWWSTWWKTLAIYLKRRVKICWYLILRRFHYLEL